MFDAELTDKQFLIIQEVLLAKAGIVISKEKKKIIENKLNSYFIANKGIDPLVYLQNISNGDPFTFSHLTELLTTNFTYFFRTPQHFDFLKNIILNSKKSFYSVWSSGCSAGHEPYSIAIAFDLAKKLQNAKIIASDISENMISLALEGVYGEDEIKNIPKEYLEKYFLKGKGDMVSKVKISNEIKEKVAFKRINLIDPWEKEVGKCDFVFCRNVLIYFDTKTKNNILERFFNIIEPGGYLFIGHSEHINETKGIVHCGNNIYQKVLV